MKPFNSTAPVKGDGHSAVEPETGPHLEPQMPFAKAGRAVLAFNFGLVMENEAGTLRGEDPEALHDMRVATRRLRAALHFMAASNGQHAENPKIKFHRARRVRISANRELDANSDKDLIPGKQVPESTSRLESEVSTGSSTKGITFGGGKDYTLGIEIVPQALSVICGKGIGLSLPVEAVPAVPPLSGPQPQAREGNGSGNGSNP